MKPLKFRFPLSPVEIRSFEPKSEKAAKECSRWSLLSGLAFTLIGTRLWAPCKTAHTDKKLHR